MTKILPLLQPEVFHLYKEDNNNYLILFVYILNPFKFTQVKAFSDEMAVGQGFHVEYPCGPAILSAKTLGSDAVRHSFGRVAF